MAVLVTSANINNVEIYWLVKSLKIAEELYYKQ